MSSYFSSYFGNSGNVQSSPQHTPGNSGSGSSTWGNSFSSRIANLRKTLTNTTEQDDPDSEDCSHVSNVLRAYYTEKGRPFPPWLPPDPKKPVAAASPPIQQYGSNYSGYGAHQYGNNQQGDGRGAGIGDIWDSSPTRPAVPATESLRRGGGARLEKPVPQSLQSLNPSHSASSLTPPASQGQSAARPLPSQRAGSYQTSQSAVGAGVGSRDRLRAKLGGSSGRNSSGSSGSNQYSQNTYKAGGHSSQGNGGSGGSGQPYMSATQPWAGGGFDDGYYGPDGGGQRQRPSGPR